MGRMTLVLFTILLVGAFQPKPDNACRGKIYGFSVRDSGDAKMSAQFVPLGSVVRGIVVAEDGKGLLLDGKPCDKSFYRFRSPFVKRPTGRYVDCSACKFEEVAVEQK